MRHCARTGVGIFAQAAREAVQGRTTPDPFVTTTTYFTPSPLVTSPITTASDSPPARQLTQDALRVRRRAHDNQPDPHVERAKHFVARDAAALAGSAVKIGGTVHARVSIDAAHPSGSTRGRFSVMPPPVMCAIP